MILTADGHCKNFEKTFLQFFEKQLCGSVLYSKTLNYVNFQFSNPVLCWLFNEKKISNFESVFLPCLKTEEKVILALFHPNVEKLCGCSFTYFRASSADIIY